MQNQILTLIHFMQTQKGCVPVFSSSEISDALHTIPGPPGILCALEFPSTSDEIGALFPPGYAPQICLPHWMKDTYHTCEVIFCAKQSLHAVVSHLDVVLLAPFIRKLLLNVQNLCPSAQISC